MATRFLRSPASNSVPKVFRTKVRIRFQMSFQNLLLNWKPPKVITLNPLFTYTQFLHKPSDMSKTNNYLKQVIYTKPKMGLFRFWFFYVGLSICRSVCLSVRAISCKLRKPETWIFLEMFIYTYSRNAICCFSKFLFHNPQPTVYFSHCLFRPKVCSNLLVDQNYSGVLNSDPP